MAAKPRPTPRPAPNGARADSPMQGRDVVDALTDAWASVSPEFGTPELELSRRVARLYRLIDEVMLAQLAPLGLTRAEFLVLSRLRSVGAPYQLRPTDLTAGLLLSSGGTSNVLNRLARAGLVGRVRDENDGRSSGVRLTQAGVDLTEASMTEWTRANSDVFRTVPPEIAQSAADALRQVLLALGDRESPPTGAPGLGSPSPRSRATRS